MKIKKSTLKTIGIVLACVLIFGALVGLLALFDKKSNETTNAIHPTYAVGGLTAQGKYEDTKGSIYTKDAFRCQGLDIDVAFTSNVSYKVYFYDFNNNFINCTSKLTENFDETTIPYNANFARIVITPNEDENVSWWEISKYSKQLTIKVAKNQKEIKVSSNLFAVKGYGLYEANGSWTSLSGGQISNGLYFSEDMNIADYNKLHIEMPLSVFENSTTRVQLRGDTIQSVDLSLCETNVDENNIVSFDINNVTDIGVLRIYTAYNIDTAVFSSICVYGVK